MPRHWTEWFPEPDGHLASEHVCRDGGTLTFITRTGRQLFVDGGFLWGLRLLHEKVNP